MLHRQTDSASCFTDLVPLLERIDLSQLKRSVHSLINSMDAASLKTTYFVGNTHTNTSNTIICERDTKQKNQERSRHQQISLLDKLDRQSRHLFRENQQLTLKLQDKARQLLELKRQRNKWTEKKKRPRTSSHEQMRPSSPTRKKLRLMTDEQLRAELQRRSMRVSDGDSRSSVCISDLFLTCVLF